MRQNRHPGLIQDLNFTNLVDVALMVLVVFIITAPMMTPGIDVNLPRADASLPHDEEGVTISIKENKDVYIEDENVPIHNFESRLKRILDKKPPGIMVYLRADKNIDYGFVIEVVGRMRKAGVKDLGLVAEIPQE